MQNLPKNLVAFFLLVPVAATAQTQANGVDDSRFSFRVGGQAFTKFTTTLRLDSETLGEGTEVTLETDTDLKEETAIGRIDLDYWFSDRHSISMSYYNIERDGSRVIDREIEWDGEVFPINTGLESRFDQQVVKLSYAYTFMRRTKGAFGASFGLHNMRFDTGLRSFDNSRQRSNTLDAPLPVIGLRGQYRFGDRWRLVGSIEWFDVQSGDAKGVFSDTLLTVEHDTWDRYGIGFGLNSFGFDVEAGDDDLRGIIDMQFDAFVVYFRGAAGTR